MVIFLSNLRLSSAINQNHSLNAQATFHSRITKCYTNNESWGFTTLGELDKYLSKCHTDWQSEPERSVFCKKIPLSLDAFFLPIQLKNLQPLFFICVQCARRCREINENWITWAASGVTQVTDHVFVWKNLTYGCTSTLLPKKVNLLHEQHLMRPPERMPERGWKDGVPAWGTHCNTLSRLAGDTADGNTVSSSLYVNNTTPLKISQLCRLCLDCKHHILRKALTDEADKFTDWYSMIVLMIPLCPKVVTGRNEGFQGYAGKQTACLVWVSGRIPA